MQLVLCLVIFFICVFASNAFKFNAFSNSILRANRSTMLCARGRGRVKFFDATKGFGFIVPDDGSPDLFVHQSKVHARGFRSLAEGEDVEFDTEVDPVKGKSFATNVTGPDGDFVKGAPRPPPREPRYDNFDGGYDN